MVTELVSSRSPSPTENLNVVSEGSDTFVICMFKSETDRKVEALEWIDKLQDSIRAFGGKIQMRCHTPKDWEIFDGRDNIFEPNHITPAVFDFDCFLVGAFQRGEKGSYEEQPVHSWWKSDAVFRMLMNRKDVKKIGVYAVEGVVPAMDIGQQSYLQTAERLMMFEFMVMESFQPVQKYLDGYKRCALLKDTGGVDVKMLISDSVFTTFMGEIQLDAVCASAWRMKSDAIFFYESDVYQRKLLPLRKQFSRSLVMVMPVVESHLYKKKRTPLSSLNK